MGSLVSLKIYSALYTGSQKELLGLFLVMLDIVMIIIDVKDCVINLIDTMSNQWKVVCVWLKSEG